jgi:hypothetical protein
MTTYPVNSKVWWNGRQWRVTAAKGDLRELDYGDRIKVLSVYSLNKVPANNGGQSTITEPRR